MPPFCLALRFIACTGYVCLLSIFRPIVRSFIICPPSLPFIFSLFSFSFSLFLHLLPPSTYFPSSLSHHRPSLTLLLLSPSLYTHSSPSLLDHQPRSLHSTLAAAIRWGTRSHLHLPSILTLLALHTHTPLHTPTSIHKYALKLILTLLTQHHNPYHYSSYALAPSLSLRDHIFPIPPPLFFNTLHLVFASLSAPRAGVFPSLCLLYAQFHFLCCSLLLLPHPPIEHHGERKQQTMLSLSNPRPVLRLVLSTWLRRKRVTFWLNILALICMEPERVYVFVWHLRLFLPLVLAWVLYPSPSSTGCARCFFPLGPSNTTPFGPFFFFLFSSSLFFPFLACSP